MMGRIHEGSSRQAESLRLQGVPHDPQRIPMEGMRFELLKVIYIGNRAKRGTLKVCLRCLMIQKLLSDFLKSTSLSREPRGCDRIPNKNHPGQRNINSHLGRGTHEPYLVHQAYSNTLQPLSYKTMVPKGKKDVPLSKNLGGT